MALPPSRRGAEGHRRLVLREATPAFDTRAIPGGGVLAGHGGTAPRPVRGSGRNRAKTYGKRARSGGLTARFRAGTVDWDPSLRRMMAENPYSPQCSSDRGRILRNEWLANAGVNIAEKTASPPRPWDDEIRPTGRMSGESSLPAAGGPHCGEYATVGFRTVAAATPNTVKPSPEIRYSGPKPSPEIRHCIDWHYQPGPRGPGSLRSGGGSVIPLPWHDRRRRFPRSPPGRRPRGR